MKQQTDEIDWYKLSLKSKIEVLLFVIYFSLLMVAVVYTSLITLFVAFSGTVLILLSLSYFSE